MLNNAATWTKYTLDFQTPKEAEEMSIYFKVGADVPAGETYWDDVSLMKIPAPPEHLKVAPLRSVVFQKDSAGKFHPNFLYNRDNGKWEDIRPESVRLAVKFSCSTAVRPELTFSVMSKYGSGFFKEFKYSVPAGDKDSEWTLEINPELDTLPHGHYDISLRLNDTANGNIKTLGEHKKTVSIIHPFTFPKLEPVEKVTLSPGSTLVNGKPFTPVMFSHNIDISTAADFHEKLSMLGDNVRILYSDSEFGKTTEGEILNANINHMRELLEMCQKCNSYGNIVLCVPTWGLNRKSKRFHLKNIEATVRALKDHPALFMWDLIDEPDLRGIPVAEVKAAYDLIKSVDPNHPVQTNLCNPELFKNYAETSDTASYDRYPYPYVPLSEIQYLNDLILKDNNYKKALNCYLQTYNSEGNPLPPPEWLKAEIYLCVTQGMRMFSYYAFWDPKPLLSMSDSQELQSRVREYNIELATLSGMLNAPQTAIPKIDILDDNSIHYIYRQFNGEKYFIAVNTSDKTTECQFVLPGNPSKNTIGTMFEDGRTAELNNDGVLKEKFLPYETHIFKY
jgi:hypothetical protein